MYGPVDDPSVTPQYRPVRPEWAVGSYVPDAFRKH